LNELFRRVKIIQPTDDHSGSVALATGLAMTIPGFFQGTAMPNPGWWGALWPDPAKVVKDVGVRPGMHVWLGMDWDVAHSTNALFMPVRRHISFGITQQFRLHF